MLALTLAFADIAPWVLLVCALVALMRFAAEARTLAASPALRREAAAVLAVTAAWAALRFGLVREGVIHPLEWLRVSYLYDRPEWDARLLPLVARYALGRWVDGPGAIVTLNGLFGALTVGALHALWRRCGLGAGAALGAAALFAFTPHWLRTTATTGFEPLGVLLLAATLEAYLRWATRGGRTGDVAPAALLLLAMFQHGACRLLWVLVPLGLWQLVRSGAARARVPWWTLGAVTWHGAVYAANLAINGDGSTSNAVDAATHAALGWAMVSRFVAAIIPPAPLALIGTAALVAAGARAATPVARWLGGVWFGLTFLVIALATGQTSFHGYRHLVFVLPPMALFLALGMERAFAVLRSPGGTAGRSLARRVAVALLLLAPIRVGASVAYLLTRDLGQNRLYDRVVQAAARVPPGARLIIEAPLNGIVSPLAVAVALRERRPGAWAGVPLSPGGPLPTGPLVYHFDEPRCFRARAAGRSCSCDVVQGAFRLEPLEPGSPVTVVPAACGSPGVPSPVCLDVGCWKFNPGRHGFFRLAPR